MLDFSPQRLTIDQEITNRNSLTFPASQMNLSRYAPQYEHESNFLYNTKPKFSSNADGKANVNASGEIPNGTGYSNTFQQDYYNWSHAEYMNWLQSMWFPPSVDNGSLSRSKSETILSSPHGLNSMTKEGKNQVSNFSSHEENGDSGSTCSVTSQNGDTVSFENSPREPDSNQAQVTPVSHTVNSTTVNLLSREN